MFVCVCVTTNNEKREHGLKEKKERCMGEFEGDKEKK